MAGEGLKLCPHEVREFSEPVQVTSYMTTLESSARDTSPSSAPGEWSSHGESMCITDKGRVHESGSRCEHKARAYQSQIEDQKGLL